MKTVIGINFKVIIITTLVFLFGINWLSAKEKTSKTLVDKKFNISKSALLRIDHKYGEVNCKNWNEDAISVKVTASIEISDQDKAEKIFSKIRVIVEGSSSEVSVETDFNDNLMGNEKHNLTIKVEIFMPKSVRLEMDHKFGNAYIEVVNGVSEINSEYGTLEIGSLTAENSSIEIGFGKGKIQNFVAGELKVNYSNFDVIESKNLHVEANYSDLSVDKVVTLDIENEGGKLVIGQVDVLQIDSKFSDCEVDLLAKVLKIENEYGGFKVRSIQKTLTNLTVENSFGAVDLYFEPGVTFDFTAEMSFCTLEYPKDLTNVKSRNVTPTESSYQGTIGKGNSSGARVEIESEYGGVSINMK